MHKNEIHIWYTYSDQISNSTYNKYENWLCHNELKRLDGYILDVKKRQFVISRALIKTVLSRYDTETTPGQWKFIYNQYGKPYIKNYTSKTSCIHFNISHSKNMNIIAVANQPIGIDCEYLIKPQLNIDSLEYFLTCEEIAYVYSIPESQRFAKITEFWTLKEAFVKAIGVGSNLAFKEFCIVDSSFSNWFFSAVHNFIDIRSWKLLSLRDFKNYIVSIALHSNDVDSLCKVITRKVIPDYPLIELDFTSENHCFCNLVKCVVN